MVSPRPRPWCHSGRHVRLPLQVRGRPPVFLSLCGPLLYLPAFPFAALTCSLRSLPTSLSFSLCLSLSLSFCLSVSLSLFLSLSLSLSLFFFSASLYVYMYIHAFIYLSFLSIFFSVCYLYSLYLYIQWYICPSTSLFLSGSTAVRYGSMRENVLNLTAVLADGTIVRTGSRARKSSAGYDLTRLLIGSEGTLAVITEATLKLHGIPKVSKAMQYRSN